MIEKNALIFGHNDYAYEIEKNIKPHYEKIYIFKLEEEFGQGADDEFEIATFDLSDDWSILKGKVVIGECVAFCILEDMSKNIFLTISLRDAFRELKIVALAQDKESAQKLMLAGASIVIPAIQTTANVIVEMLEKPIVREVMHSVLYEKSDLKISQVKISDSSCFHSKSPLDINWEKEFGVVVLSIVHENSQTEFIYSIKTKEYHIKNGDVFVIVGYEKDIKEFEKIVGGNHD
jgi:voltage-gated potassium channel